MYEAVANNGLIVQQVDGALDQYRPWHTLPGGGERLPQGRHQVTHPPHAFQEFDVRANKRFLVNIL